MKYIAFLVTATTLPYKLQATVLYTIERVYQLAWTNIHHETQKRGDSMYGEFAERWGNTGFVEYVALLGRQAEEAKTLPIALAPGNTLEESTAAVDLEREEKW
eukprot:CAMPEP_0182417044 /NCGR_PEP_ID=MMETSP1167-20130531/1472_1 /TAXON_ID=2988 /ORGANISM="Mallomonas Sp, Strain CCMP3275" /LENGTH=102 /DNA_ID=CAMNT_0024590319 /DNA_START=361 /DNA_END=666 /DNA_ORIENTATION=+